MTHRIFGQWPLLLLLFATSGLGFPMLDAQEDESWRAAVEAEAHRILDYWMQHAVDTEGSGFHGRVDIENTADPDADRSAVLNTRILWTFSAAGRHFGEARYRPPADRAYAYLAKHFIDPQHGGVYWAVEPDGTPADASKQIYAQSFAIYALAEYHHWTGHREALDQAIALYRLVRAHAHDPTHGGYAEAFRRDWTPTTERYLTGGHEGVAKTMNTHLHLLEAFSKLFVVWPDDGLRDDLEAMLALFEDHIFDGSTRHLDLFFEPDWSVRGDYMSFGHDIEASWLLMEAAERLGGPWPRRIEPLALKLAESSLQEGLDQDGGLMYEAEPHGMTRPEKSWWPQAEAMVGFYNAYQLTGEEAYREASRRVWTFIEQHLADRRRGEWLSMLDRERQPMGANDKVNAWKGPYHNTRSCLEMHRRLGTDH